MHKFAMLIFYGFLVWLLPFLFSLIFFDKKGILVIDKFLFMSVMIVFSSIVGMASYTKYIMSLKKNYLREGVLIGVAWLIINLFLDFLVLIPMTRLPLGQYFKEIGLQYLIIPVISISVGYILDKKVIRQK